MNLLDQLVADKIKPNLTILDFDLILYFEGYHYRDALTPLSKIAFKENCKRRTWAVLDRCKADYYMGFYSSSGKLNFRNHFDTIAPYKGQRTKEPYVKYFEETMYQLFEEIGFYDIKIMEA